MNNTFILAFYWKLILLLRNIYVNILIGKFNLIFFINRVILIFL